ncbi:hypothetical protein RI129_000534 [Pyrocoelia pectoralis]|uniref:Tyr recombinase domain-containing protein n=1 Tax=Pyrocoelia pectoralis TaxID=417401 RepID=A0AAN7ZJD4_9COLE
MLRTMLNIKENIDISKFARLIALLKTFSKGYLPKKSKILEFEHITKFLGEAPDNIYLAVKVVLIMGYSGACRREELTNISVEDVEFKSDSVFVSVPKTKTNVSRLFVVSDLEWIRLIQTYAGLRPPHTTSRRFFLNYRNGSCTIQPIGINKIGQMPKTIAMFLDLPNSDSFSGHCFRRSSASHLANSGGDLLTIKRHGGWKSSTVAEGYVEASIKKKVEVSQMLSSRSSARSPVPSCSQSIVPATREEEVECTTGATTIEHVNSSVVNTYDNIPVLVVKAGDNCVFNVNVYNNCSIQK